MPQSRPTGRRSATTGSIPSISAPVNPDDGTPVKSTLPPAQRTVTRREQRAATTQRGARGGSRRRRKSRTTAGRAGAFVVAVAIGLAVSPVPWQDLPWLPSGANTSIQTTVQGPTDLYAQDRAQQLIGPSEKSMFGADAIPTKPQTTAAAATAQNALTTTTSATKPGAVLDGRSMGGWYAGASGLGVADGALARWLGQPVSVTGVWADTTDEEQRRLYSLTTSGWNGAIDVAVGGTVLDSGENYAAAASGAYDERWREAAAAIAKTRKGATGPTFLRPFHEMNGSWYGSWMVTRENSADFKRAFARYAGILRQALPEAYIVWSPNFDDSTDLPVSYWYPGDDVVDVVGIDYYDDGHAAGRFSVDAWNAEASERDHNGNPTRPESWRQFAADHGKPIAFPEWGLKPEGGGVDHPQWITAVNKWMNAHANTATWQIGQEIPQAAAGKVLYSVYFNVVHEGQSGFTIYGQGENPNAAAAFRTLRWGRNLAR